MKNGGKIKEFLRKNLGLELVLTPTLNCFFI